MQKNLDGIGRFSDDCREYVIENMQPTRPLINYLWSENVVADLDHFGKGKTMACEGEMRRPFMDGHRLFYIKDLETGESYCANRNFENLPFSQHRCHVGLGYQKIISIYEDLRAELCVSVPKSDFAELTRISVKNEGKNARRLSLYFYAQPTVNVTEHLAYGRADFCEKLGGLLYEHNAYQAPHEYGTVYVKSDRNPDGYALSDVDFIGHYNGIHNPKSLAKETLVNKGTLFEEHYCAAFQFNIELAAGEEIAVNFVAGTTKTREEAVKQANKLLYKGAFEENLLFQREFNDRYTDIFTARSSDSYLDTLANVWLKRQVSLGKTWGRVYSKGFRDVMQDIAAFVSLDPELAKKRILEALFYQRIEGNPLRQFSPIVLYPYNDGAAWIPATILAYLNETGDLSILDEQVGYYDDKISESVFEHIMRGLQFLTSSLGERGLVLFGGGDWNDSLNNVGNKGRGESVWLSIATVKAIDEFTQIANLKKDYIAAARFVSAAETMKKNICKYGWDGKYFIYGYNDLGEKIGTNEDLEARIYLNPQTWAVLAGILDKPASETLMQTVEDNLKCEFGYVQNSPSYSIGSDNIGRVSYFSPGTYENGSVYNHGVAFKIAADCALGKGDAAYNTLKMISYDNPKNLGCGAEPYAVSNMYFGPDSKYRKGYAPLSWITGTAGWLYRCISEYMFGIQPAFNGIHIQPCFPSAWQSAHAKRLFRGREINIEFIKSDIAQIDLNGKILEDNFIPFNLLQKRNDVKCYFI